MILYVSECVIFLPLNYSPNSWQSQVKVKIFVLFSGVQLQNITQRVHSEDTWCVSLCCPSQFSLVILNILNPFTFLLPCTSVPPIRDARAQSTCLTMCFFRAVISKQRHLNITCGISILLLLLLFYICKMNKAEP